MGCGFVGLANATLLSFNNRIFLWDTDKQKRELITKQILPFDDDSLSEIWSNSKLDIDMCHSQELLVEASEIIIIALPTNWDIGQSRLNTDAIESVVDSIIKQKSDAIIVIRSTIPVGFTKKLQERYQNSSILFMPEFLREGHAYYDMVNPTRIIIGGDEATSKLVLDLFTRAIAKVNGIKEINILTMKSGEAEAVKLFSNTYLAMRVAFFNEIDQYADNNCLSSRKVIEGICEDPRIGNYYNNPSFGYGGYCLPKDVNQTAKLLGEDAKLINAIADSNRVRKNSIVDKLSSIEGVIGFYRLQAKKEAKNIRYSATKDILDKIVKKGRNVYLYEPSICDFNEYENVIIVESLDELAHKCDVIVADRITTELLKYKHKIFSRDNYFYEDCR